MNNKLLKTAIFIFVLVFNYIPTHAGIKENVFRIKAAPHGQDSMSRMLTGFRLKGKEGIFTALHGVVGCSGHITAENDETGEFYTNLSIIHVDIKRDIALLGREHLTFPKHIGLNKGAKLRDATEKETLLNINIVGHPLNVLELHYKTAKIDLTQKYTSWSNLDPDTILEISERGGSPDLNTRMLYVQGHILPGHSGAPILDEKKEVIGIANGGLDKGRVEIGLAVPIWEVQLESIHKSKDRIEKLKFVFPDKKLFGIATKRDKDKSYKKLTINKGILFTQDNFIEYSKLGNLENVQLFLDSGIFVDIQNKRGRTALFGASLNRQSLIVDLLLKHGADVNQTIDGCPIFIEIIDRVKYIDDVISVFLKYDNLNINANCKSLFGRNENALTVASKENKASIVSLILKARSDIEMQSIKGESLITNMSKAGKLDIVTEIAKHAKVLKQDDLDTAFKFAASKSSSKPLRGSLFK